MHAPNFKLVHAGKLQMYSVPIDIFLNWHNTHAHLGASHWHELGEVTIM